MKRTFIIAEAGVNHNGSLDIAKRLIDAASEAGADAVKFQTFVSKRLVSKGAGKARYQLETTDRSESQLEMLQKLELDKRAHEILIDHCRSRSIQFLSTPFDLESVRLLADELDVPLLKVPSGDITNAPLLLAVARTGKPVILSTGMSTIGEVETALGVLAFGYLGVKERPSPQSFLEAYGSPEGRRLLREKVTLLHCTTEYPAPYHEVNLRAMDTLRETFQLEVGYSDHTLGLSVPIAAVARGATVIEKHFTLDRNMEGPDHRASLEPDELKALVRSIREVEAALGDPVKTPTASEIRNKEVVRKSVVAARAVRKGEIFTEENLTCKRPGNGMSPLAFWDLLGKPAPKDYAEDEPI